jgi:pimeloyl-ACP methyl ester carboxylesterase
VSEAALSFTDYGGAGPAVLLLHGGFRRRDDWVRQVATLQGLARVITADLPGHGHSPAHSDGCTVDGMTTAVDELLAELGVARVIAIGHSFSCRVIVELARRRPERVAGLVLVDGSRTAAGSSTPEVITERVRREGARPTVRALFDNMFVPSSPAGLRTWLTAEALAFPLDVMTSVMVSSVHWDATEADAALAAVRCPVLAVQSTHTYPNGTRDALRTPNSEWLDLLRDRLGDLRIDIVTESGHFSMIERPEAVSSSLRRFVVEIAAAERPGGAHASDRPPSTL